MAKGNRRNKNFTAEGFEAVRNENYYTEMAAKRSSSAAGSHDSRPNRERTRASSKRAAIKQGW